MKKAILKYSKEVMEVFNSFTPALRKRLMDCYSPEGMSTLTPEELIQFKQYQSAAEEIWNTNTGKEGLKLWIKLHEDTFGSSG